jgi:hypothetical protein
MKIEVGKTYLTDKGARVRIIAVDRWDPDLPVVALKLRKGCGREHGEGVVCMNAEGTQNIFCVSQQQERIVRELSPWDDVARDTLVWVRHPDGYTSYPRYFWGVENGKPRVYDNGRTSATVANGTIPVEKQVGADFHREFTTSFNNIYLTKPLEC